MKAIETRLRPAATLSADSPASPETVATRAMRKWARMRAAGSAGRVPENLPALSPEEERRALHEVRIHQLDIELQDQGLDQWADALAAKSSGGMLEKWRTLSPEAAGSALRRVRVHQVEIEIQNRALRERAEALATERALGTPEKPGASSPEVEGHAVHELLVHQIELEIQNEELRRTQEELERARVRYFDLYDLAPVAYFTLSEQGFILEANLTAAKLLGVARDSLAMQPLSNFIVPADQDIYYLHRKALWETGTSQVWEMRVQRKDAAPLWARVEATSAREVDGALVCRAVVSDITESKRAEGELKTANAALQEFAYALTHDLQEPLRMVVTFNQLLKLEQQGKLGHDADQYIAYSVQGALRIEALLEGLLNYLEVTDPDKDQLSTVDCNHVLSEVLVALRAAIDESGAKVTSDRLPTAVANEFILTQLLQNLVGNSIKYRSEATPAIHISAARAAEGWLFSVRDNGIGIDPSNAQHVFGMFKRLHGNEIPGNGIGLALCRKLVERHGGRIWVESDARKGSTFKFTVPIEEPT